MTQKVYNQAEIQQHLQQYLPNWTFTDRHICRTFKTAGWKASMMLSNAIGHLAELAWHHPDILISYPRVIVRLMNHEANGITDKDFTLARRIEEFVTWQAKGEGGLSGTPDDARFRYLIED